HVLEVALDLEKAVVDEAAVDLELGFTRAAEKAETAALALQVGPGSNQPASLITKRGKFYLELAFGGAGPRPEDLQDEAGAIDDLAAPFLLQVTLLHWSKRIIDDGEADLLGLDQFRIALNRPLAEQRRWSKPLQRGDFRMRDVEVYGAGQAD